MKKIVVFSFLIGLGIILFSSGWGYLEQNPAPYIKLGLDYYHLEVDPIVRTLTCHI